jgi:restriction system protein
MSVPKYFEFMKPELQVLSDKREHTRKEIYIEVTSRMKLTPEQMQELIPSGYEPLYINRISWGLTYLKKSGLIESPRRAVFKITKLGLQVLKEDPEYIDDNILLRYESYRNFYYGTTNKIKEENIKEETPFDATPQDQLDKAYEIIKKSLSDDLLQMIMEQTPEFFETLVVRLLVKMGYGGSEIENGLVTKLSNDEGIDGIIKEDKLGFDKIYIQAKRWDLNSTVGRPELQKFVGALVGQGATKGAFITTAKFAKGAIKFAEEQHTCKIVLIDGEKLSQLMIEHNLGVSISKCYEIKDIDTDFFRDSE